MNIETYGACITTYHRPFYALVDPNAGRLKDYGEPSSGFISTFDPPSGESTYRACKAVTEVFRETSKCSKGSKGRKGNNLILFSYFFKATQHKIIRLFSCVITPNSAKMRCLPISMPAACHGLLKSRFP